MHRMDHRRWPRGAILVMRKFVVVGVLVAALGVPATSAQAHTLLPRDAASAAWLAAYDWAEVRTSRFGDVFRVTFPRSRCYRRSRHVMLCWGEINFEDYHYGTYEDWTEKTECTLRIRVRLTNWDTRTKVDSRLGCISY
jgi:hypothetical protein